MISGNQFRKALLAGAMNIANKKRSVDELNVYPVPDGDTGTNMSMTLGNSVRELSSADENTPIGKIADMAASALLRGARGNSGVITSLIFRGFSKGFKDLNEASVKDIANALDFGVQAAYKAVMNPTEGTILTVARLAAEKARELSEQTEDCSALWDGMLAQAKETLAQTTEMLPQLKKANVVDAGGQGLVLIFEAMGNVFRGEEFEIEPETESAQAADKVDFNTAVSEYDDVINFTYCTEFIVEKYEDAEDASKLRAYLETIGDCVVVVEDDEIIKVHVHTNSPGMALTKALEFGHFINEPKPKIENMKIQHENKISEAKTANRQGFISAPQEKEFGFVAIGAGAGIVSMFHDLGVDEVVEGGQTMNPSTDDILNAIHKVPAKMVFVLPNNKNIIMAAEQAQKLADRGVCVLQTRTIPQGISAMLSFVGDDDFETNRLNMTKALEQVSTGQITYAARDSEVDGKAIHKGEILAMENGKLAFAEEEITKAVTKLAKRMIKSDSNFVTLIYGADVTEDKAMEMQELIQKKYGDKVEVSTINGGQPVYYYILSVE